MDEYEKSKCKTKRYKKLRNLLKAIFGYDSFRPKQYEIINRIISKEDVCAVLPTGHGKSLTYQIPALYFDKPAVIISPLISLMDDQQLILKEMGISSCCYNSTVANKWIMKRDIMQEKYKFIYITPEAIINMREFLKELDENIGISLIAIDEAHCISSYGFDFRRAYRSLDFLKECLPDVPILAVTATATNIVAKDICKVLKLKTNKPIKSSFDRPNLYMEIRQKSKKIDDDIVPIIKKYSDKSIIIYCLTKKETKNISEILKQHKIKCGVYHADIDNDEKLKTHHDFIKGKIKVIAATIAFGMGINKSDVRVVIHYGMPKNVEGYYQEIGRAGRDGKKAYCYTFYNKRDFVLQELFIGKASTDGAYKETQRALLKKMKRFVETKQCRRQILLEYFDEEHDGDCGACDNCCGTKQKETEKVLTKQTVDKEARMLINLIEYVTNKLNKNFGMAMYVNILRGSNNKHITEGMRKSGFYNEGKHRSVAWWKEMSDHLLQKGFLQQVYLRSGRFPMQVVKVTRKGLDWSNLSDFGEYLDGLPVEQLEPIEMNTTI